MTLDEAVEFAVNPEPRCPCLLLLDTSGSMQGPPIDALNQALAVFRSALIDDPLASKRVEIAIVTFDSEVKVIQDYVTVDRFDPPILTTAGTTHMGSAIQVALDLQEARKRQYRGHGIAYYRPWVLMITDGEPQGESDEVVRNAAERLRVAESEKGIAFFAVGVGKANLQRLGEIVVREPLKLQGLRFQDLFLWLSTSLTSVSQSRTTDQIALPPPTGWAEV